MPECDIRVERTGRNDWAVLWGLLCIHVRRTELDAKTCAESLRRQWHMDFGRVAEIDTSREYK